CSTPCAASTRIRVTAPRTTYQSELADSRRPSLPLITAAFIAHAAGLLLGFGGFSLSGCLVAAALGGVSAVRRDARLAALALLGAAGVLRSTTAATADARCARQAISATPESDAQVVYTATLEGDATRGARVPA